MKKFQEHLDNYVLSRGLSIEQIIPVPNGKPYEIKEMYGEMDKGGMSVKISVKGGCMFMEPYGYNGEEKILRENTFLCPTCGNRVTLPVRARVCNVCGDFMRVV